MEGIGEVGGKGEGGGGRGVELGENEVDENEQPCGMRSKKSTTNTQQPPISPDVPGVRLAGAGRGGDVGFAVFDDDFGGSNDFDAGVGLPGA
jgi:hypothetical protein